MENPTARCRLEVKLDRIFNSRHVPAEFDDVSYDDVIRELERNRDKEEETYK